MTRDLALAGGLAILAHVGAALLLRVGPVNAARVDLGGVTVTPVTISAARWASPAPESHTVATEHGADPADAASEEAAASEVEPVAEPMDAVERVDVIRGIAPALAQAQRASEEIREQVAAAQAWAAACVATLVRDVRSWLVVRGAGSPVRDEATSPEAVEPTPVSPGDLPTEANRRETTPVQAPSPPLRESAGGAVAASPTPAVVIRNEPPVYPTVARRRGYSGVVELRIEVLADGTAGRVELLKSSGHEVLDEAAIASVRRWRFRPATRGGVSEVSWIEAPVIFRLERVGD